MSREQVLILLEGDNKNLKASITDADKAMGKMGGQAQQAESKYSKAFGGIKRGAKVAFAAVGAASVAAGAVIGKVVTDSVKEFSEFEQQIGGTEAVFGKFAQTIQDDAKQAYKNMGTSANNYMQTANVMGSLFQGSGISQKKSLELTSDSMQRAADVASVMGIDTKFALDSIAGAAKGNFTMMDNLGVAMNATTLQAYALEEGLDFEWKTASNAEKSELAMKMFMDRTQQYAGNFAREADETISGSMGRLKANWQDMLAAMSSGDAAFLKSTTDNLMSSVSAVAKNLIPVIKTALESIVTILPELTAMLATELPPIIETIASGLAEAVPAIVDVLISTLPVIMPILLPALVSTFTSILTGLIPYLPSIISNVIDALWQTFTTLISSGEGIALVMAIVGFLAVKVFPLIAGKISFGGLASGLAGGLGTALTSAGGAVSTGFTTMLKGVVQGLGGVGAAVIANIPQLAALAVAFVALGGAIGLFWKFAGTAIKEFATLVGELVATILPPLGEFISTILTPVLEVLADMIVRLVDVIGKTLVNAISVVLGWIEKLYNLLIGGFNTALKTVTDTMIKLAAIARDTLIGALEGVQGIISEVRQTIRTFGDVAVDVFEAAESAAGGVASAIERIIDAVIRLIDRLGRIKFPSAPSWVTSAGSLLGFADGGLVGYASGGVVRGAGTSTSDSITARLSRGEFVIKAASVRSIGIDNLNAMNQSGRTAGDTIITVNSPQTADPLALSQQIAQRVRFA